MTAASSSDWKAPWVRAQQRVRADYGWSIGKPVDRLSTPALVVDLEVLDRNIEAMSSALAGSGVALRPHTKVQKSPDLALRQIAAGAVGVTVATVWEAAAMLAAGIEDVLVANEVVGPHKVSALGALSRHGTVTVVVDDETNIHHLADAAVAAGGSLGVLVDLDVGMQRCGARSLEEAVRLAELVEAAAGLRLVGVQAYEGHCMLEPDAALRVQMANQAMDTAAAVSVAVSERFPAATTLSGGGTGTYAITGRHPRVTELQAGSYVFMDAFHGNLVPGFEVSLHVLSTVMARHGDTVILDAGRKSVGIDFVSPPIAGHDYEARYYAEEHALFDVDERLDAQPGDQLRIQCGYAPTTVNLHEVLYVVEQGTVVDVWSVFPRGPSDHGFLTLLAP